jgi:hypothetical protein
VRLANLLLLMVVIAIVAVTLAPGYTIEPTALRSQHIVFAIFATISACGTALLSLLVLVMARLLPHTMILPSNDLVAVECARLC